MALLNSSFDASYKNDVDLSFENGYIKYHRFSSEPIELHLNNTTRFINFDAGSNMGYQFEAIHAMECLDKDVIESPILSHSFSLKLMETLDAIRKDADIVYPNHDSI